MLGKHAKVLLKDGCSTNLLHEGEQITTFIELSANTEKELLVSK